MTDLTMFAVALTMLLAFGCGWACGLTRDPLPRARATRKQLRAWRRERLAIDAANRRTR